jgi:hypothetical protein
MAAPRSRRRWPAALLVVACLLVPPAASAADGDPGSVFDEPIADVAIIERGGNLSPDLLTIDTSDASFGIVSISLLRRDTGWSRVASLDIPDLASGMIPWLVDLADGRFAVVTVSGNRPQTFVVPVFVDPDSAVPLRTGGTVVLEMAATDAGAADVDEDAGSELIVAGNRDGDAYSCAGSTIEVLGGDHLVVEGSFDVPKMRLAGAALGEWDGRPGADLLVHAYETCPILPDSAERHHLLSMRLRDGSTIVDMPAAEGDPTNHWPSLPLVVDVDGDGRDEAIVRTESTFSVVDPMNGWAATTIAEGSLAPLVAMPSPTGASALVTWAGSIVDGSDPLLWFARISRERGSLRRDGVTLVPPGDVPPDELGAVLPMLHEAELSQQPPLAWAGDLDGDGCPEILAPLVHAGCLGTGVVSAGSLWLGTRPLAVVGPTQDRRLLAALGYDWYPYIGGPTVPAPAAAGAAGAWRHGPSNLFSLAELPLPTVADRSAPSVVAPQVDPIVSADGTIDLTGPTGSRQLVRIVALPATDTSTSPEPVWTRTGFLRTDAREFEFAGMVRIPVPAGTTSAESVSSEPFDIRSTVSNGPLADRWYVAVATLDAWGNVSDPVATTAIYDVMAPTVSVEVPFLSAPWPLDGAVAGTSEPGITVRLGDDPPVTVGADGSFTIRTQLAPWPQTLEVTAEDPSGNATTTTASVMGGLDLRQLPWPAIAAFAIIVAVGVSSLRGGRRVPSSIAVVSSSDLPDADRGPVIEELPASPVRRRD